MHIRSAGAALALLVSLSTAAGAQEPFTGDWILRMAEPSEARVDAPAVHVMLLTPGMNTFYIPMARMEGLTAAQVAAEGPARFRLRHDAGTFAFDGSFSGGRGKGRFGFTPDPAFAAALERRGMARPTAAQQFSLARHGVGIGFLDELAALGYARPTTDAMERAGVNGAGPEFLREMAEVGYRLGTVDALIRMRASAVTGPFVREMAALGYRDLSASDAMQAATQGVSGGYVRELARLGYRGLPLAELVRLRVHDVTPAFAQRMNERERRQLTSGELVHLRNRGAR